MRSSKPAGSMPRLLRLGLLLWRCMPAPTRLLLLLLIPTTAVAVAAADAGGSSGIGPSREKPNIFVRRCPPSPPNTIPDMFPLDQDPRLWPSCDDAYTPTWYEDPTGALPPGLLTERELHKLARSMGFCPHRRCQLGDVGNSPHPGECPAGLCYTKLEAGAPSFGACCFDQDGIFNAGHLIGYHDLLRATPKPIYKRGRVVLGGDPMDESREAFIAANEVLPGVILTQCPVVADNPQGATPTLAAFLQMLQEQRVGLVLQLDPHAAVTEGDDDEGEGLRELLSTVSKRGCGVWPTDLAHPDLGPLEWDADGRVVSFDYTVGGDEGLSVRHRWYYGWRDFAVPGSSGDGVVLEMAREAAGFIRAGRKVVVACHSGRGRSGTLAAIIAGLLHEAGTVGEAVDLIVRMREARDGLVETPQQFAYIARLLGLRPTPSPSFTPIPPREQQQQEEGWVARLGGGGSPAAALKEYEACIPAALALLGSLALLLLFLRSRGRRPRQAQPPKPQRKGSQQPQAAGATATAVSTQTSIGEGGEEVEGEQEERPSVGGKRKGLRRRVGDWGRRMLGLPPKGTKEKEG